MSIFDYLKDSTLDIKLELKGGQLGEYFGASLLAVDLNMDDFDELLVGAPQHSIQPELSGRSGDEGKVYVYVNKNGELRPASALYGSRSPGSRFGTAIASAGDINRDRFNGITRPD